MRVADFVFGRPLASTEDQSQRIGASQGIPIFGLDALSSAAYGPEAALTVLLPLGLVGVQYLVPLTAAIIALLSIVYLSYRQTIAAYPSGGGSYTVATENVVGYSAGSDLLLRVLGVVRIGILGVEDPHPSVRIQHGAADGRRVAPARNRRR